MAKNVQQALAVDLQDTSAVFKKAQSSYLTRMKKREERERKNDIFGDDAAAADDDNDDIDIDNVGQCGGNVSRSIPSMPVAISIQVLKFEFSIF